MSSILKASSSHPNGYVSITDPSGTVHEADTHQCAHCARHWAVVRGSGKRRGFCTKCMAPLCGRETCMKKCDPWRKRVESSNPGV